jgi:Sec-independent protein secretion pathway component TatC
VPAGPRAPIVTTGLELAPMLVIYELSIVAVALLERRPPARVEHGAMKPKHQ